MSEQNAPYFIFSETIHISSISLFCQHYVVIETKATIKKDTLSQPTEGEEALRSYASACCIIAVKRRLVIGNLG